MKTVGKYAFINAQLSEIQIPSSVQKLEEGSFYLSDITSLTIPDSVTETENWICSGCPYLSMVRIGAGLKKVSYWAFKDCESLKGVEFGQNISELDYKAFSNCPALEVITIPEGVTEISSAAFEECVSLRTVNLPTTLQVIYEMAFSNCENLNSIVLFDGLREIREEAFYGTGIRQVNIPGSVTLIGKNAFSENTEIILANDKMNPQDDGSYIKTGKLPVEVSYDYNSAFEVLKLLNKERKKRNLGELVMDRKLLEAAMLRASELSVYFSHTRPNGLDCFSACNKMYGENVACNQRSPQEVMNSWMESEGHRENMLTDDYTVVGVGAVVIDGIPYWVQCFGVSVPDKVNAAQYKNKTIVTEIELIMPKGSMEFRILGYGINVLKVGETGGVRMYVDNTFIDLNVNSKYVKFVSSDPKICTVSPKGDLKGISPGKAVITLSLKNSPDIKTTYEVTVKSKLSAPKMKSVVSTGYNSLKVTWNAVNGAKSYIVYYKGGDIKDWKKAGSVKTTSFTHKSLNTGTTYTYTVRAVKGSDKSAYNKKGISGKPVPSKPVWNKISKLKGGILLQWKKVSGTSGYDIYCYEDGKWNRKWTTKNLKVLDEKARKGYTNKYKVRAFRIVNEKKVYGPYSVVTSFKG